MDVRCFEEESSDTIIYNFCAGLETVKDAVVNPEVETPSTLVFPCANSCILVPLSCLSPSSHFLASGSEDMQVTVWLSQLRKWSFSCQSLQTGIPMSHSVLTALEIF